MSPSSPPPATRASKRHSLNISIGPRPLHLVEGNPFQTSGPATAPLTASTLYSPSAGSDFFPSPSSSKNTGGFKHKVRRQSSISYHSRDRTFDRDATVRSPLGSSHSFVRISPLGTKSKSPGLISGEQKSVANEMQIHARRSPPMTLAEKHSELLHFIAQKESKCLELRSQLAIHEAELLQLKRKWERIINRGLANPNSDGTLSPNIHSQGGGAMLEGIREGVQGVSRFIAAGLAMGELSSPSQSPSSARSSQRSHSTTQSSSSMSTSYTTKSTRLSQSSASSIEEASPTLTCHAPEDAEQILMVRDTGATPTMSPNPEFMHKYQQQQEHGRQVDLSRSARSSSVTEQDILMASTRTNAKVYRRKSKDDQSLLDELLYPKVSSTSPSVSPSTGSATKEVAREKRVNNNVPALEPLTVGSPPPPVSSWVGSVGKKWGELQRGSSFSKSHKRASLLLSDVSQSIASVLSPPTSTWTPPPSYYSPSPLSPTLVSPASTSLIDDDDNGDPGLMASSIMTPDTKAKLQIQPPRAPPSNPALPVVCSDSHSLPESQQKLQDDDEEWNW